MSVSSNKVSVAPLGSRRDVLIGAAAMDARPFDPFRSTERAWRNSLARRSSSSWRMVS
jgi:hypothetical protein